MMINRVADKITRWVIKQLPDYRHKQEILRYGLSMAIYTSISTLGLIGIGLLFNDLGTAVIIIAVFYLNQTVGGGVHSNSHAGCFWTMVSFLVMAMCVCRMGVKPSIQMVVSSVSCLGLYFLPVVMHSKKSYLAPYISYYTQVAQRIVFIEGILFLVFFALGEKSAAYSVALFLSFLSRSIAITKLKLFQR